MNQMVFSKKMIVVFLCHWSFFIHSINAEELVQKPNESNYSYQLKIGTLLNYHTFLNNYEFKNKLTENGRLIASPLYIQLEKNYADYGFHFFISTDSIASPMVGVMAEKVIDQNQYIKTSLFAGGYFVDAHAWGKIKDQPKFYANLIKNRIGIALPVAGYKAEYHLYQDEKFQISSVLALSLTLIHLGFFFNIPL